MNIRIPQFIREKVLSKEVTHEKNEDGSIVEVTRIVTESRFKKSPQIIQKQKENLQEKLAQLEIATVSIDRLK